MENREVKEENLTDMIKRQRENLGTTLAISERILAVLRGEKVREEANCMKEECLFDTCCINSAYIGQLEANINEIARKIMG